MSLSSQISNLTDKNIKTKASGVIEANIVAHGDYDGRYTIKLRNNTRISDVPGPTGLSIGDSVAVIAYPGVIARYVIVNKSYKSTGEITTIWV